MFNVNFSLLAERLLPLELRRDFMIAWLAALLSPLAFINEQFTALFNRSNYLLNFNSQKLGLEWLLRNTFGQTFSITNNLYLITPTNVYPSGLGIGVPEVYPSKFSLEYPWVFPQSITPSVGVNFTVTTSSAISGQEEDIKALIDRLNHAGFTYELIFV